MSSSTEIALASIKCFTNDGKLDEAELDHLISLAMRDGAIDEDERSVLANIFSKISEDEVSSTVWFKIETIKRKHGV